MASKKISKSRPKIRLNVWVLSAIILAVGLIISVSVLLYAFCLKNKTALNPDDSSFTEESSSFEAPVISSEKVKVSFYDDNNKILAEKTVDYGSAVFPPTIKNDISGKVFLGWSRNLSYMTKDTQIYAVFDDYSKRQNVISFDTVYIDSSDNLEIKLKIGGIVDIASFNMKVCYDDSVLKFKELTDVAEGLDFKTAQGEIEFILDRRENLTEDGSLAMFRFDIEDVDFIKTDLVIQLEDGKKLEGGELKYVDCTMVNGTIYIY